MGGWGARCAETCEGDDGCPVGGNCRVPREVRPLLTAETFHPPLAQEAKVTESQNLMGGTALFAQQ